MSQNIHRYVWGNEPALRKQTGQMEWAPACLKNTDNKRFRSIVLPKTHQTDYEGTSRWANHTSNGLACLDDRYPDNTKVEKLFQIFPNYFIGQQVKWVQLFSMSDRLLNKEGLLFVFLIIKSASFLIFRLRNLQIYRRLYKLIYWISSDKAFYGATV